MEQDHYMTKGADEHKLPTWQLEDAATRLGDLIAQANAEGPQLLTSNGNQQAVLVSMEEWRRLSATPRPNLKELLLAAEPKWDDFVPVRRQFRHRDPPNFDD